MTQSTHRLAAGRRLAVATLAATVLAIVPAAAGQAAPPANHLGSDGLVRSAAAGQPAAVVPAANIADCKAIKPTSNGLPLCFWAGPGYTLAMGNYAGSQTYWGNWTQSQCDGTGTWNDCASALYNAGSYVAVVWKDAGHNKGEHGCIAPGTAGAHANLGDYRWPDGSAVDNSISSNSWVASGCP